MAEASSGLAQPGKRPTSSWASMVVSKQLQFAYSLFVLFLSAVGVTFTSAGLLLLNRSFKFNFDQGLPSALTLSSVGVLLMLVAYFIQRARRYLVAVKEATAATIAQAEFDKLSEDDFETLDRAQRVRQQKDELDFQRNLGASFTVEQFSARQVILFNELNWNLQPGVNVLLGRNGYGKSLLLKTLAGALQHDDRAMQSVVSPKSVPLGPQAARSDLPLVEVRLKRDGTNMSIRRDALRFVDSVGKVPLLAIPDSRFFDRSQTAVGPSDTDTADLRVDGAYHFLNQLHYGGVIQGLLYEICLDYWEHGRSFDLPVFNFLQQCVTQLTGYRFAFHSIERQGRTGFEIRVRTEGNEIPLPIQYASQGTLSVIAMFGLIRSYVAAISGKQMDKGGVQRGSAIVMIDEADAHLHPTWQQKFSTVLRQLFPDVQFILSAHSPFFVAGCWNGEVAILRRQGQKEDGGFVIDQPNRDFIGADPAELYRQVFEIEQLDDTFLEYSVKASQPTLRATLNSQLEKLAKEQERAPHEFPAAQEAALSNAREEVRRIRLVEQIDKDRRAEITKDVQIAQQDTEIAQLASQLSNLRKERTEKRSND